MSQSRKPGSNHFKTLAIALMATFDLEMDMGLETRIKPISYLKVHSAEVIRDLGEES